ncbi:MAG: DUF917 domain-containing protein [Thermoanaerobacterales bacterium]|nr:DUF917 domain-containing protein [Thermoanaerobacterales bacterium]
MSKYVLKASDIEPLLEGLTILGTGGGGSPKLGRAILENDIIKKNRQIIIETPEAISDNATIVSGGIMGSVAFLDKLDTEKLIECWEEKFELIEAIELMSQYIGKKIDHVVPFEVGALNTPVILSLAARMGISVVDGDSLGRSAPETQMASFLAHGISLTPMPLVDTEGNKIIVVGQKEATFADEVGRFVIAKENVGMGANSHYAMTGAQLKQSVIPNTITKALRIGKSLLEARKSGSDTIQAVVEELDGLKMFEGKISSLQAEDKGGFYITNVRLEGKKEFEGTEAKLVIKNETMALWVNDKLKSVFPDLVCMLDTKTGSGVLSTDLKMGKNLVLVGTPCHSRRREGLMNPDIAKVFGGDRYGCPELRFVEMEELNRR